MRVEQNRITPAGAGKTLGIDLAMTEDKDHPRRCGENQTRRGGYTTASGSPPQVRGKQDVFAAPFAASGITPAGAGKTSSMSLTSTPTEDHPRRCGENPGRAGLYLCRIGSPPQVRGKLRTKTPIIIVVRITPAGAGKTNVKNSQLCNHRDHPRRCGENENRQNREQAALGSPPQVRGKLFEKMQAAQAARITPAGAGKTSSS